MWRRRTWRGIAGSGVQACPGLFASLVYAVPFLCSILTALTLSMLIPMAHTWPVAAARRIAIAAVSTVVLYGADRLTRRMLPLAALLSLTLAFPDEAPSRFKIAMRSGGTVVLQRRLEQYRRLGANEPALAAQRLLELVADLSRHDRLTRGHSERVRAYSQMIGEELGLSEAEIDNLRWAALLHDIGKLEIPFEILNKPGRPDSRGIRDDHASPWHWCEVDGAFGRLAGRIRSCRRRTP